MEDVVLSRYPQHTWLGIAFDAAGDTSRHHVPFTAVAHVVSVVLRGRRQVRVVDDAGDTAWTEDAGAVHFLPADGRRHTLVTTAAPGCLAYTLLIPRRHLLDGDGTALPGAGRRLRPLVADDDACLRACMTRLAAAAPGCRGADGGATHAPPDEAARALIRRLLQLNGGGPPDWHDDTSVFDRRLLERIVNRIDAALADPPSPDELSLLCGTSSTHFARKFRHSTGLSLHRFVNRRRLRAALEAVSDPAVPLSRLAIDLGFSSQSHFTRLFSELTGMTPARCRRHFGHHCR